MDTDEGNAKREREFYNFLNKMYKENNKVEISSEEEIDEWFSSL